MDDKNKTEEKNIEQPKVEEEKTLDKYQEPVRNAPDNLKEKNFGEKISTPEVEKKEDMSPEVSVKKELSPEIPIEKEKAVEVEKPDIQIKPKEEPAKSVSAKPIIPADDKASRNKKVEEIKKLTQKEQVEALKNLALKEGPGFAIRVAKELNDAFVLDEFHDKLDRLGLIKEGKLEEI